MSPKSFNSPENSTPLECSALSAAETRIVLAAAVRAPSLHNTQPWLVQADPGGLTLWADRSRHLPATDPSSRGMILSCGAALFNLRVALRHLGRRTDVVLLPDPREPDLLARIGLGGGLPPTRQENRWNAAVYRRHTHRGPFLPVPVDPAVLRAMQAAAAAEGGTLHLVERPGQRRTVISLIAAGERAQQVHPQAQRELTAWTPPPDSTQRDGVPAWSYSSGAPPAGSAQSARDFDRGRGYGRLGHDSWDLPADAAPAPPLAVLTTPTDGPDDHLRAGQALQAALLTAAVHWVFASLHSQPIESESTRRVLHAELGAGGCSHLLLQLGRADSARPTPRRPVAEVLRAT